VSRNNKVNPDHYTMAGRLTADELARQRVRQGQQKLGGPGRSRPQAMPPWIANEQSGGDQDMPEGMTDEATDTVDTAATEPPAETAPPEEAAAMPRRPAAKKKAARKKAARRAAAKGARKAAKKTKKAKKAKKASAAKKTSGGRKASKARGAARKGRAKTRRSRK
jgi:hypothetical protein